MSERSKLLRQRLGFPAGIAMSALLVVGCGTSANPPAAAPTTSTTPRPSTKKASGLSDRLILPSYQLLSGTPISGTLVVVNSTGKTIEKNQGCVVRYQVILENDRYKPTVVWPLDCEVSLTHGAESFPAGVMRIPITVTTVDGVCAKRFPSGPNGCDLPPGVYRTELVTTGSLLPPPPPVQVTLLTPR